ncbi:23S rRNA m(2)A-2503 methyltransferase [Alkalispirochaeta americana]|uniref:23S rRNA m(2)A-2503 methyltransferase n=2 Tax=Alkalispirochaeta americana TaxID=159291 RepID=A0A1N6QHX9_9SPIO|nr:23S rRNA m(2)A-2503 methyltransferase [Alkalispirochaeta americana]
MSPEDLREAVSALGHQPYRADQICQWIYRQGARSLEEMKNLPGTLRQALAETLPLDVVPPARVLQSADGTKKYLFPVAGGAVEAALIPDGERSTLCLSTQVGCRRACSFCQTGRQGFQGNLTVSEILNQYHSIPERSQITNIVFMGMGEPLDNSDATFQALDRFTDPQGYGLSARRITLSTVGIHPQLEEFFARSPVELAISLHNPFPRERQKIMPVERDNPIEETLRLIRRDRQDRTRRISFEYTLLEGFNDTPAHVEGLAKLLNGLRLRINLIPYHTIEGSPLRPTSAEGIEKFSRELQNKGMATFVRRSRGEDINAACGLLWTKTPLEETPQRVCGDGNQEG